MGTFIPEGLGATRPDREREVKDNPYVVQI